MIRRPPRSTLFPYTSSSDLQARRQPGSGFKPFIYAAAFDKGFTPASVVLDAPVVIDEEGQEQDRKSTRLNSSHQIISYAVFCLKKKTRLAVDCQSNASSGRT